MQVTARQGTLIKERAEITVLGIFDAPQLEPTAKEFDRALGGMISRLKKNGDFRPKLNNTFLLPTYGKLPAQRLLLVGLGKNDEFTLDGVRQVSGTAIKAAKRIGIKKVTCELPPTTLPAAEVTQAMVEGAVLGHYGFNEYKHLKPEEATEVTALDIVIKDKARLGGAKAGVKIGQSVTEAVSFTRDLVNMPGGQATPSMIASQARAMARRPNAGLRVKVLSVPAMKKLGMNGVLGVARGSSQPPAFIILEYGRKSPGKDTVVLVGKGVTFDSGGISIKPSHDMDKMKYDMAGAATVLGAVRALAALRPSNVHLVGLLPCVENMPGGRALKPGDILRCLGDKSVEVQNTDAEGRLILADALAYARRYRPAAILDVATLTGACVVALGHHAIGMMGNNRELIKRTEAAGDATHERVWQLPLWKEYGEAIKSDVADIKNIGNRAAGTITAAKFLEHFVGKTPWVHLDIAGVAWAEQNMPYTPKGASATGVRLLVELIMNWKKLPAAAKAKKGKSKK